MTTVSERDETAFDAVTDQQEREYDTRVRQVAALMKSVASSFEISCERPTANDKFAYSQFIQEPAMQGVPCNVLRSNSTLKVIRMENFSGRATTAYLEHVLFL